jgi:hypothetical protein
MVGNFLNSSPFTLDHYRIAIKIIAEAPSIAIVENEVNAEVWSGISTSWRERALNLQNGELLPNLNQNKLATLRRSQQVTIKILTINKTSLETLIRYSNRMEGGSLLNRKSQRRQIERQPLIDKTHKEDCCSCTLQ